MRKAVGATVSCVVLALSACTSGTDDRERTDPPSSAGSPSESAGEVPTEPSVELPESTPLVEPATGPVLDVEGISVRIPQGWRLGYDTPFVATARGREGIMSLSTFPGPPRSLRSLLKRELAQRKDLRSVERLDDVAIGGRSAFHYRAREDHYVTDEFGLSDADHWVSVSFDLSDRVPPKRRRLIVESVLATYESEGASL